MPCFVGTAPAAGIAAGVTAAAVTKKKMKKEGFSEFEAIVGSSLAAGAAHTAASASVGAGTDWIGGSACVLTGGMHAAASFLTQSATALGKKLIEEF